ncbi:hypothetical protein F2Q69_00019174 [Brassica cretica]|uniref:FBD domain-containing protein n=1 Tax=Brassica cretica TaxID=69181 RepID=A0A8S9QAW0_BRACR|nr:hypothetical protein F2Q69_00019174 [Brassica cretica]
MSTDSSPSGKPKNTSGFSHGGEFLEKSFLHKLKLKIMKRKNDKSCVTWWVNFVARRKLKHLDVEYLYVSRKRLEVMPISLFVCETLLYLRLSLVLVSHLSRLEDLSIVRRLDDNDITHSKVDTLPIALSSVPPQCLLSSLEFVEIKSRYEAEFVLMELARYFSEISVILKKLVVSWKRSKLEEDSVVRNLLALQWRYSICQIEILFYLPTKEAVKTSVLSHRWETLWLLVSELDLNSSEFPDYNAFAGFGDRFLEKSCLHKLKLKIMKRKNDKSCVTWWADFVARRKLKHLDVEYLYVSRKRLEVMPISLCVCETLLYLRLSLVLVDRHCLEDLSIVRRLDDNDITHSKFDTLPIALSSVPPQCLLSSLEFVEIKSRYEAEFVLMELARYFAEISVILKKLVVSWKRSKLEEDSVLRELDKREWRKYVLS